MWDETRVMEETPRSQGKRANSSYPVPEIRIELEPLVLLVLCCPCPDLLFYFHEFMNVKYSNQVNLSLHSSTFSLSNITAFSLIRIDIPLPFSTSISLLNTMYPWNLNNHTHYLLQYHFSTQKFYLQLASFIHQAYTTCEFAAFMCFTSPIFRKD